MSKAYWHLTQSFTHLIILNIDQTRFLAIYILYALHTSSSLASRLLAFDEREPCGYKTPSCSSLSEFSDPETPTMQLSNIT